MNICQKLILFNQYEILKKLNPEEKDYYEENQSVLVNGSDSDIEDMASFLTGTSEDVKQEVYDILEMFSVLERSYKQNHPDVDNVPYNVGFKGFDGNEESEYYSYCKHLIDGKNLYSEFKDRELNSHCNVLARYRTALQNYKDALNNRVDKVYEVPLTDEEIENIID